jgi:hypothetical protein
VVIRKKRYNCKNKKSRRRKEFVPCMTRVDSVLSGCSRCFFESDVIYIQSGKDLSDAMNMG